MALMGALALGPRLGRTFKRDGGGPTPAHDLTDFDIGRTHGLDAVQAIGQDGRITEANETFLSMTGYSGEDLAAGKVHQDTLTPAEWMPRTREASLRSTSMPLCDSSTTTCAPLPRASSTTVCRFSSWMPKLQSATL